MNATCRTDILYLHILVEYTRHFDQGVAFFGHGSITTFYDFIKSLTQTVGATKIILTGCCVTSLDDNSCLHAVMWILIHPRIQRLNFIMIKSNSQRPKIRRVGLPNGPWPLGTDHSPFYQLYIIQTGARGKFSPLPPPSPSERPC
jgi:hypothetical protein